MYAKEFKIGLKVSYSGIVPGTVEGTIHSKSKSGWFMTITKVVLTDAQKGSPISWDESDVGTKLNICKADYWAATILNTEDK